MCHAVHIQHRVIYLQSHIKLSLPVCESKFNFLCGFFSQIDCRSQIQCFTCFVFFPWLITSREYSVLDGSASGEVDWQTAGCSTTTIWGCLSFGSRKHLNLMCLFLSHICSDFLNFLTILFCSFLCLQSSSQEPRNEKQTERRKIVFCHPV